MSQIRYRLSLVSERVLDSHHELRHLFELFREQPACPRCDWKRQGHHDGGVGYYFICRADQRHGSAWHFCGISWWLLVLMGEAAASNAVEA